MVLVPCGEKGFPKGRLPLWQEFEGGALAYVSEMGFPKGHLPLWQERDGGALE